MKLIKHYTTKDKKYYKYEIVIPNKKVEEAKLSEKDELDIIVRDGEVRIKRKK
jgi:bifunctional DNA-binding transcriptional regulator/antitoxin component of YhaV-PrlF toxin-antitoxin module